VTGGTTPQGHSGKGLRAVTRNIRGDREENVPAGLKQEMGLAERPKDRRKARAEKGVAPSRTLAET